MFFPRCYKKKKLIDLVNILSVPSVTALATCTEYNTVFAKYQNSITWPVNYRDLLTSIAV